MKSKLRFKNLILSFALIFTLILSFLMLPITTAYAGTPAGYTNALEDLKKNSAFNEDNYPANATDYKIEVLTIAESEDSELFIYTYQPAKYSKATSINISTDIESKTTYDNYKLEYLNNNGVFYKYKVLDFTLPTTDTRIYEISNILRKFDENIDTKPESNNTIDEVPNSVAKQFIFDKGGTLTIKDVETITVTSKYIGYLRYEDSWLFQDTGCDVHFVAFSTDKRIDDLLEAQISYSYRTLAWTDYGYHKSTTKDESGKKVEILKKGESFTHNSTGWFSKDAEYQQILEANKFIEQHDIQDNIFSVDGVGDFYSFSKISDETQEVIKNEKWVLTFAAYPYKCSLGQGKEGDRDYYEYTYVSEVTLLRLRFKTDGVEYNLGVVDNKSTGDLIADNISGLKLELEESFKILLGLILGLAIIVILWPFISPIIIGIIKLAFKGLGFIIKWVFKIAVFILLFPWNIIFKKKKRK